MATQRQERAGSPKAVGAMWGLVSSCSRLTQSGQGRGTATCLGTDNALHTPCCHSSTRGRQVLHPDVEGGENKGRLALRVPAASEGATLARWMGVADKLPMAVSPTASLFTSLVQHGALIGHATDCPTGCCAINGCHWCVSGRNLNGLGPCHRLLPDRLTG